MIPNLNTPVSGAVAATAERQFPADLQARNEAAMRLLNACCTEDAQEQRETWAFS